MLHLGLVCSVRCIENPSLGPTVAFSFWSCLTHVQNTAAEWESGMPRKKRQRISLHEEGNTIVLDMGPIEIWDGADLALLRETVSRQVEMEKRESISFAMQPVKYVPSGFFGMLLDCFDRGIEIHLLAPNEHVQKMLWFQRFFATKDGVNFFLHSGPSEEIPHDQPLPWASEDDRHTWDANESKRPRVPSLYRT